MKEIVKINETLFNDNICYITGCDELCEGRKPAPSEPGARKVKTFEKLLFHFLT